MQKRVLKVNRAELLTRLRNNMAKHEEEYAVAMRGWQTAMVLALRAAAKEASKLAKMEDLTKATPRDMRKATLNAPVRPVNYAPEYRKAIAAFEAEVEDVVELSAEETECYIHDEWEFTRHFRSINSTYVIP